MFTEPYFSQLKDYLNFQVEKYNTPAFIPTDPISIPHRFSLKQDIEIAGFLTSVIAWGNRKIILKSAERIMELMEHSPYAFITQSSFSNFQHFEDFVHRTFNGVDLIEFTRSLKRLYEAFPSMEDAFLYPKAANLQERIALFKDMFFANSTSVRSFKHLPDPRKGSAAKRMNIDATVVCALRQ